MESSRRTTFSVTSLVLLALLFIALVILSNVLLRGVRFDLTENNLYTTSQGTRNILRDIEEPINLYFFFSESTTGEIPALRQYAARVRETIEEYAQTAGDEIILQVIDPQPFSEEEDQASAFGLQSVPAGPGGESVFFGLAGTNAIGEEQSIPFFDPAREAFLEYDLTDMVYRLSNTDRSVVGLMSTLPMDRGFDPATRQMREPWTVTAELQDLFEVRTVATTVTEIDDDIDVLLVVHPKNLTEDTLFAIDQFVLRGGKLMAFLDPHSELDVPPQDPSNPTAAMLASRTSNLERLLPAWGVAYDPNQVVLDARYALQIQTSPTQPPVRHLGILGLTGDALDDTDVITADLTTINASLSGHIAATEDAQTSFEPLLTASELSMQVPADRVRFMSDPSTLLQGFAPDDAVYVLAARLSGPAESAFPERVGHSNDTADTTEGADAPDNGDAHGPIGRADEINVMVFADTDVLGDRLWVQISNFLGRRLARPFANNGDMIVNAVENFTGNSDLISIRGKAVSNRPFTRIQELEQAADARFRATEEQLESRLRETERRLTELQQGKSDEDRLILSDEQEQELLRFQQEKLDIRKQLREVRRSLREEIQSVESWLRALNTFLVPAVLTLLALGVWFVRSRRGRAG